VGLIYLVLPTFNHLAGKELSLQLLDGTYLLSLVAIALLTGLLAGSYPALLLSGYRPVVVLQGKIKLATSNLFFRNGLVVFQFALSLLLFVGTVVVYKQLNFIRNKNLGFEQTNLLYFPVKDNTLSQQEALKTALQQHSSTSDFSLVSRLPTNLTAGALNVTWEGKAPDLKVIFHHMGIDDNFIEVFGVAMLSGRNFSDDLTTDTANYLVNEKAVEVMGMDVREAIGQSFGYNGKKGTIIGVVKNFNFKPLQYAIEPMFLRWQRKGELMVIRTPPGAVAQAISSLEKTYQDLNPGYPFTYHFVDEELESQYQGEQQMGQIFTIFAGLALFISCLGLYGLAAFVAEQRTKEISIRKVLGANILGLVNLLSQDFFRLVVAALLLAVPLSWYFMNEWLHSFAYRTPLSWWVFIVPSMIMLIITLLTISGQVLKTAFANPVDSLRNE
ncbi:MAG: FtsX-like permease family protein, partial [Bacteroidota bacterium]